MELKIFNDTNEDIKTLRYNTFVVEKNVPEDVEFDGEDNKYLHFCLYEGEKILASLRADVKDFECHIGRVAVLSELRGKGLGKELLTKLQDYMKNQKVKKIHLGAIDTAVGFYEKMGFKTKGEWFTEGGHPHICMEKIL